VFSEGHPKRSDLIVLVAHTDDPTGWYLFTPLLSLDFPVSFAAVDVSQGLLSNFKINYKFLDPHMANMVLLHLIICTEWLTVLSILYSGYKMLLHFLVILFHVQL
jgi:hypothetical protein